MPILWAQCELSVSDGWVWIENKKPKESRSSVLWKYLFFSADPEILFDIAVSVMHEYWLPLAKIPEESAWDDYVLCIYSHEDKLSEEFKKLRFSGVRYVRWKSDEETNAWVYSNTFLKKIWL